MQGWSTPKLSKLKKIVREKGTTGKKTQNTITKIVSNFSIVNIKS